MTLHKNKTRVKSDNGTTTTTSTMPIWYQMPGVSRPDRCVGKPTPEFHGASPAPTSTTTKSKRRERRRDIAFLQTIAAVVDNTFVECKGNPMIIRRKSEKGTVSATNALASVSISIVRIRVAWCQNMKSLLTRGVCMVERTRLWIQLILVCHQCLWSCSRPTSSQKRFRTRRGGYTKKRHCRKGVFFRVRVCLRTEFNVPPSDRNIAVIACG